MLLGGLIVCSYSLLLDAPVPIWVAESDAQVNIWATVASKVIVAGFVEMSQVRSLLLVPPQVTNWLAGVKSI